MNHTAQPRPAHAPYPVELTFPDIRRWREGNQGLDYVHSFDSGQSGPHVLVTSLVHGNEVSGALALDALLRAEIKPRRGRLSLAFVNVDAYEAFDLAQPDATRFLDEDLNRVWTTAKLDGQANSREVRRAQALRALVDSVDLLLDIHSMHEASAPLMMAGPVGKGLELAAALGTPALVIADKGHANGRRLRDYGGFIDPASAKNALLVETGQHFAASAEAVALDTLARFLVMSGVVDEEDVSALPRLPLPARQRFLEVTDAVVAQSLAFRFEEDYRGLETIAKAGTPIARDGERVIVTPYDDCVLVQPSLRQLAPGVTVVRLAREIDAP